MVEVNREILNFYDGGAEIDRLKKGIGKIEFERTKEIFLRYLPQNKLIIYDIGGGTGIYSRWLSELGHEVHLIDPSSNSIEFAKTINKSANFPIHSIEIGDARSINRPDASADIVLLMGPLYHLTNVQERLSCLNEAKRVLKKGGLLLCTGITRYGSMLWSLSIYGTKNRILDEEEFFTMIRKEIIEGQHIRPENYPYFIPRSYFHLPKELEDEIKYTGFIVERTLAIEGPSWLVPYFDEAWENEVSKKTLLNTVKLVEEDINIMTLSPHFLTVSIKE